MPYFLSDKNLSLGIEVEIAEEEARHILLSHRVKVGEEIKIQGPDGKRFLSEVVKTGKKTLTVKALKTLEVPPEPIIKITLFQAVVSEKALDMIFQKATELGVSEIVLFNSDNTATKLSHDFFKKKYERWNKILWEAGKQCERVLPPKLDFRLGLSEAIPLLENYSRIIICDAGGGQIKPAEPHTKPTAVFIGPEGGFSPSEAQQLKELPNSESICLSLFILRSETAAIAAIAKLNS